MNKQLARVEKVYLEIEDHGLLTLDMTFDYGGGLHGGFGGRILDTYDETKKRRVGTAAGCDLIIKMLQLFNTRNLSDIEGKVVYVLSEDEITIGSRTWDIIGLETPPFENSRRFYFSDWGSEWGLSK